MTPAAVSPEKAELQLLDIELDVVTACRNKRAAQPQHIRLIAETAAQDRAWVCVLRER